MNGPHECPVNIYRECQRFNTKLNLLIEHVLCNVETYFSITISRYNKRRKSVGFHLTSLSDSLTTGYKIWGFLYIVIKIRKVYSGVLGHKTWCKNEMIKIENAELYSVLKTHGQDAQWT